jgi:hypothetical protein
MRRQLGNLESFMGPNERSGDLALTESRVIIREGCRTLPVQRVVTVEFCLIDISDALRTTLRGGRNMDERGARTGEGDSGLTPLVTMFSGASVSYDIPHGFPCTKAK